MPDMELGRQEVSAGAPSVGDKPVAAERPVERPAVAPAAPVARASQRNPVFSELVQGEEDLAGLVGYALYKLNKRDWLATFFKTHGRDPTEEEVQADSEEYAARSGAETTSDGETDGEAAGESEESAPAEQAAGE